MRAFYVKKLLLERTHKSDHAVDSQKNTYDDDHNVEATTEREHKTGNHRENGEYDLKRVLLALLEYVEECNDTLDGNKIVAENRTGTMIYYTYDDKGSIMGMIYNGQDYIFSKNLQGDVIGIYNSSRQLVAKYEYSAYGRILATTDANGNDVASNASHIANINPFRYRGYYYDTETGFYYLQSRYYDPVVGRFLNADDVAVLAVEQGSILQYNAFAYCLNDPVNRVDEIGNWSWPK